MRAAIKKNQEVKHKKVTQEKKSKECSRRKQKGQAKILYKKDTCLK